MPVSCWRTRPARAAWCPGSESAKDVKAARRFAELQRRAPIRAPRAKKTNNSHCPALRRRRRGEEAPSGEATSWLHWKGKVRFIARYRLYPASRVSGRGPAGLGKPKAVQLEVTRLGSFNLSWILVVTPGFNRDRARRPGGGPGRPGPAVLRVTAAARRLPSEPESQSRDPPGPR